MRLFAETSGKNAIIVTPSADLDQAIADLVRSAFGHAGQKCSAASLGIVVGELYDDPAFRTRLREAVRSIRVGPATEPATMMGPLIQAPAGPLGRALTTLEAGESWLLEPTRIDTDPTGRLWTPGVRLDVAAGSWFHQTECFGPVLGMMRARDLDHAIALQNGTPFGLTGGIHTLDTAEIERWLANVEVGNAYVNRHITGAIVRRQPFGGWKRSTVGGGAKPGGPGHVAQFTRMLDPTLDPDAAHRSFARWPQLISSTPNTIRARWRRSRTFCATARSGASPCATTAPKRWRSPWSRPRRRCWASNCSLRRSEDESDREFAARCVSAAVDRVRLLCDVDDDARRVLHRADIVVDDTPPVGDGALELRHWVREQSVSRTTHRHGRTTA